MGVGIMNSYVPSLTITADRSRVFDVNRLYLNELLINAQTWYKCCFIDGMHTHIQDCSPLGAACGEMK